MSLHRTAVNDISIFDLKFDFKIKLIEIEIEFDKLLANRLSNDNVDA